MLCGAVCSSVHVVPFFYDTVTRPVVEKPVGDSVPQGAWCTAEHGAEDEAAEKETDRNQEQEEQQQQQEEDMQDEDVDNLDMAHDGSDDGSMI